MRRLSGLVGLLAILGAADVPVRSVAAADPAPTPAPAVAGVTVTAPSVKRVPDLIKTFGRPYSGDRLSRWREPVCPYVAGFAPAQNSFIAARIVQIAKAARVLTTEQKCEPNIIVVATPQSLALRRQIATHAQTLLSPQSRWPVDKLQLSAFVKDDGAPVHIFYASGQALAFDGAEQVADLNPSGNVSDTSGALARFGAPEVAGVASRLTPNADDAFQHIFVVLDGALLDGATGGQIAAYVSMITLAEVRVEAPQRDVDTIASLFADRQTGRTPPADLTFWDRAYLGALYNAPTQISISLQRSVMADRIEHAIEVLHLPPPPVSPAP